MFVVTVAFVANIQLIIKLYFFQINFFILNLPNNFFIFTFSMKLFVLSFDLEQTWNAPITSVLIDDEEKYYSKSVVLS